MEIEIYDFSCLVGGCCDDVVIFLATGVSLAVIYLLLTRDLGWRLSACLRVDRQVLVA
jgi:hypothetical protein